MSATKEIRIGPFLARRERETVKEESNFVARFYSLAEKVKLHGMAITKQVPSFCYSFIVHNH